MAETAAEVHDDLVASLAPTPGERWLDIATGTGAVAARAARAGAHVIGVDIAPALIDTARQLAAAEGLNVQFEVGDAERLEYRDASFDVVASAQGTMFAPDHEAVARELARVCRPGGRLGLTCWRPGGAIEKFFSLLAAFQPPPPPGAGRPLWTGGERRTCASCWARRLSSSCSSGPRRKGPVRRGSVAAVLDLVRATQDARRLARRRPPRGAAPRVR